MTSDFRPRLTFAIALVALSTSVGRAHQIHNGSFESGINPTAPSTPTGVAADPGDPNLTNMATKQPFTAMFVGPSAPTAFGPTTGSTSPLGRQNGSGQSDMAPGLSAAPRGPGNGRSGGGGGSGSGGSGSGGNGTSRPGPMDELIDQTADSLYPDEETPTPLDEADGPNQSSTTGSDSSGGTVLEKAPVWVAAVMPNGLPTVGGAGFGGPEFGSGFGLGSGSGSGASDPFAAATFAAGPIHQNPSPPGVILGLLAAATLAGRYRRRNQSETVAA